MVWQIFAVPYRFSQILPESAQDLADFDRFWHILADFGRDLIGPEPFLAQLPKNTLLAQGHLSGPLPGSK